MRTKILISALLLGILFPFGATVAQAEVHTSARLSDRVAACKQWRVAGRWTSGQSNVAQVTFIIHQAGTASAGFRTGTLTGTI
jgi:hypothetical protein